MRGTASNLLRRGPAAFLFEDGARLMPKKAYPFQLVPGDSVGNCREATYRSAHSIRTLRSEL